MKKDPKDKWNRTRWKKEILKLWSKKVRKENNYKCAWCTRENPLNHAHHIVARSISNIYAWFDLHNGMVLCFRCHIYRLKAEPDDYIAVRDSHLTEKDLTYQELKSMYTPTVRMSNVIAIEYLRHKFKELS